MTEGTAREIITLIREPHGWAAISANSRNGHLALVRRPTQKQAEADARANLKARGGTGAAVIRVLTADEINEIYTGTGRMNRTLAAMLKHGETR